MDASFWPHTRGGTLAASARNRTQDDQIGRKGGRPLFSVLKGAIDLGFNYLDCRRATCRHHVGFGPALKSEFPSPTTCVSQLNDGVFHSFVFHEKFFASQHCEGRGGLLTIEQKHQSAARYVHLCT
jgi:hypothetical protein